MKPIDLLGKVLNFSPVIHISCDERFGAFAPGCSRRLSIFALTLFQLKLYALTWGEEFSFFKVLAFEEVCPAIAQADVDDKAARYARQALQKNDEILEAQYEYLKESYNATSAAKASLETRASAYISGYLVLLGFYGYLLSEIINQRGATLFSIEAFAWISGLPFIIATATFIWSFLMVKRAVRSTFKELREQDSCIKKALAVGMYTNWYSAKAEFYRLTSQVKNIEANLAISLLIGISLWLAILFNTTNNAVERTPYTTAPPMNEYMVSDTEGYLQTKELERLLLRLQQNPASQYQQYIVSGEQASGTQLNLVKLVVKPHTASGSVHAVQLTIVPNLGKSITVKLERSSK